MAYLVEFDRRGLALQQWRLHVGSFYSIGRSTACSIVLPHISVSRLHAQLQLKEFPAEEVAVELRELGAVNGTYVNGRRLENREVCRLDSQSEILFGEARTAYRFMKEAIRSSGLNVQRPRSCSPPRADSSSRGLQSADRAAEQPLQVQPASSGTSEEASGVSAFQDKGPGGEARGARSPRTALAALRAKRRKRSVSSSSSPVASPARSSSSSRDERSEGEKREVQKRAFRPNSSELRHSSVSPARRAEEQSKHASKSHGSKDTRHFPTKNSDDNQKGDQQRRRPSSISPRDEAVPDSAPRRDPQQKEEKEQKESGSKGSSQQQPKQTQRKSRWARKRSPSLPKKVSEETGGEDGGGSAASSSARSLQKALENSKSDGGAELDASLSQILAGIQAARKKRELEKQAQLRLQEEAAAAAAVAAAAAACASGVGSSGLTVQEKRKLLWGKRKAGNNTDATQSAQLEGEIVNNASAAGADSASQEEKSAVDPNCYGMSFGSDVTRKSKFLKLMGHKGDISELVQNVDAAAAEAHLDPKFTQRLNSELELQYYQGIRRKDGRKTGLGL